MGQLRATHACAWWCIPTFNSFTLPTAIAIALSKHTCRVKGHVPDGFARRACYSEAFVGHIIFWLCCFCGWVFSRFYHNYSGWLMASSAGVVGHFLTLWCNKYCRKNEKYFCQNSVVSRRGKPPGHPHLRDGLQFDQCITTSQLPRPMASTHNTHFSEDPFFHPLTSV